MENGQIDKPTDIHSRSDFISFQHRGKRRDKMGKKGGKSLGDVEKYLLYKIGS